MLPIVKIEADDTNILWHIALCCDWKISFCCVGAESHLNVVIYFFYYSIQSLILFPLQTGKTAFEHSPNVSS